MKEIEALPTGAAEEGEHLSDAEIDHLRELCFREMTFREYGDIAEFRKQVPKLIAMLEAGYRRAPAVTPEEIREIVKTAAMAKFTFSETYAEMIDRITNEIAAALTAARERAMTPPDFDAVAAAIVEDHMSLGSSRNLDNQIRAALIDAWNAALEAAVVDLDKFVWDHPPIAEFEDGIDTIIKAIERVRAKKLGAAKELKS